MTFIIAEAGVNHNGSEERALELVQAAAASGADAVKFQTFSAEKLVRRGAATAEYQRAATGESDQYALLKRLELSRETHRRLFDTCGVAGIEFMSTPFDEDAADFLLSIGMRRIKIPSGEITNLPFLRHLARSELPLILSTGMADIDEVQVAVATITAEWGEANPANLGGRLTILHCTSNYPAAFETANLRAMATMAHVTGLPVGYSDHTLGLAVSTAAVALGASVIEKHFTLDHNLPGPDHAASLTVPQLGELVDQIRAVESALGSADKRPTQSELSVRALVRRSVATARDLPAGHVLNSDDLVLLRPADGIAPADLEKLYGRSLARAIASGATIKWVDLE